jgi:lysophospholipase L1-like esterase
MVAIFSMLLYLVPKGIRIGATEMRKMDILSDVRPTTAADTALMADVLASGDSVLTDTLAALPVDSLMPIYDTVGVVNGVAIPRPAQARPSVDSLLFGQIIEDYTVRQQGLSRLFAAVDSIQKGRTVRVAFYGDSFVEGDILIADMRDTLQTLWGGAGVGFVPITSEVARFKRTLKHEYRGWTPHSVVKRDGNQRPYGINGFVYVPAAEAKVQYEGAGYFRHTRSWSSIRMFYSAERPASFVWQQQGGGPVTATLPEGTIKQWKWPGQGAASTAFDMRFPEAGGLTLYGAALENGPGFYIDNFSMRGNSGGPLTRLQPDIVQKFDTYQQYDLIVVQVGLNAVTNDLRNIRWYEAELQRVFKHLRLCFPQKDILIVSVGDRGDKVGSELMTMRGVPAIAAMQRRLAREHGFLFFDLYHAMGGPGTMIRFAQQRPRLANLDYTHLTHEGGRVMGHLFANLLLKEQAKWRQKQAL